MFTHVGVFCLFTTENSSHLGCNEIVSCVLQHLFNTCGWIKFQILNPLTPSNHIQLLKKSVKSAVWAQSCCIH